MGTYVKHSWLIALGGLIDFIQSLLTAGLTAWGGTIGGAAGGCLAGAGVGSYVGAAQTGCQVGAVLGALLGTIGNGTLGMPIGIMIGYVLSLCLSFSFGIVLMLFAAIALRKLYWWDTTLTFLVEVSPFLSFMLPGWTWYTVRIIRKHHKEEQARAAGGGLQKSYAPAVA